MFTPMSVFTSFSVDDITSAKEFYSKTLGLTVDQSEMGLMITYPGGGRGFVYPKDNHQPASFTVLNFAVSDIDDAVAELTNRGVKFEQYKDGPIQTDDSGIARGRSTNMGPDIAWFKDPAGNIISVLAGDDIPKK